MAKRYSRRALFGIFGRPVKSAAERTARETRPARRGLKQLNPPGWTGQHVEACADCHACVDACPRDAIFKDRSGRPAIDPARAPCVLCTDVPCVPACPHEVLAPVAPADIRLGVAVIDEERCCHAGGIPCTECHTHCPLPGLAMILEPAPEGPIPRVIADHCTGCGSCVFACPETPSAVRIEALGAEVER